jgi:DNA-binding Lrp family transcriptional regulator
LKKNGVILGEHMHLNPLSVGYESIAELGILTDLADKEKIKEMLKTKPAVKVAGAIGKYDICGTLYTRKFHELSTLVQQIDVKPYVKSLDVLIFADLWDSPWHPENLVIQPCEETTVKRATRPRTAITSIKLDEIDLGICRALMKSSRTPFKALSEQLGISTSNIIERYHALREKNVLNLSTITIDLSKLGFKANVDSYIRVRNRGKLPEVEEKLLQIPNLTFCAKYVGGAYDLRVAVNVRDFNDLNTLKENIYSIENIKSAEFYIFAHACQWPNDFIGKSLI